MEFSAPLVIGALGFILHAVSMLWGGMHALSKLDSRLLVLATSHQTWVEQSRELKERMDNIDKRIELLGGTLVNLAKQEVRMDGQDQRLQILSQRAENIQEQINKVSTHLMADGMASAPSRRKRAT